MWGYSLVIANPQKWQINTIYFYVRGTVPLLHNTFALFYIRRIELVEDKTDSVE